MDVLADIFYMIVEITSETVPAKKTFWRYALIKSVLICCLVCALLMAALFVVALFCFFVDWFQGI